MPSNWRDSWRSDDGRIDRLGTAKRPTSTMGHGERPRRGDVLGSESKKMKRSLILGTVGVAAAGSLLSMAASPGVIESRQLAALHQQPFNQSQMSLHEVSIFLSTSAPP